MVVGITERERAASRVVQERLRRTRTGQRWERIFRAHEGELAGLMAVHVDLREHVSLALAHLARRAQLPVPRGPGKNASSAEQPTGRGGEPGAANPELLESSRIVLDDLQRLGSFELRRDAQVLCEELEVARGRLLGDVLAAR